MGQGGGPLGQSKMNVIVAKFQKTGNTTLFSCGVCMQFHYLAITVMKYLTQAAY